MCVCDPGSVPAVLTQIRVSVMRSVSDPCVCDPGSAPAVFTQIVAEMSSLSAMTHKFAFDIVFSPLSEQLQQVATMEVRRGVGLRGLRGVERMRGGWRVWG